jgi:hypothetical protein
VFLESHALALLDKNIDVVQELAIRIFLILQGPTDLVIVIVDLSAQVDA